jgi:hypothetical protein
MGASICPYCMKLTKRSVQLAFDPAQWVFSERNPKVLRQRERENGITNTKARSHTRYQLYRKASSNERILGEGKREGNGGSALTSGMAEIGAIPRNAKNGAAFVFPSVFYFVGRHLPC